LIAARNKKGTTYGEYLSVKTLSAMYLSIRSMSSPNDRVVFTTLHLVCEICLKKLSLHYGEEVSFTSHALGGMLHKLYKRDTVVKSIVDELHKKDLLSHLQNYPYNDIRFKEAVVPPQIPYNVMFSVTESLIARVGFIEGVGF